MTRERMSGVLWTSWTVCPGMQLLRAVRSERHCYRFLSRFRFREIYSQKCNPGHISRIRAQTLSDSPAPLSVQPHLIAHDDPS